MPNPSTLEDRLRAARVPNDAIRTSALCQQLAAEMNPSDIDELASILRANRDSDLRNIGADVSAFWYLSRIAPDESEWPAPLTAWLTSLRDDSDNNDAFEIVSSAITWKLRSERPRCLNGLRLSVVINELESGSENFDTDLSVLLQAARYDFNFERIEQILNAVGEGVTNSSLYYRAMLQYSRLGRGKEVAECDITDIAAQTDSEKILSLLLHGLWFTAGAQWAAQMLELSDRLLVINPHNAVTYMRKAAAHRRKGEFTLAIRAINTAIALHAPLDREVHNDLKLERVTIAIQQDEHLRLTETVRASSQRINRDIDHRVSNADERLTARFTTLADDTNAQISDSLFKVVEILGIFTAIIGAAAATISAGFGSGLPWWGRALIILAGGAVMIGFFFLLRKIVQPATTRAGVLNSSTAPNSSTAETSSAAPNIGVDA